MRLEGKSKGGYYPTPEPVIDRIAGFLSANNHASVQLLDPCCGTGRALGRLTDALKAKKISYGRQSYYSDPIEGPLILYPVTYGVELEGIRAKAARSVLDEVLQASFLSTTISNGVFSLLFLNPPYDFDSESSSGSRLELTFLKRATTKLMTNGVLIFIVPQAQLATCSRVLSEHYYDLSCYRFPDEEWMSPEDKQSGKRDSEAMPMFELFDQVVLFGKKKSGPQLDMAMQRQVQQWAEMGTGMEVLPEKPGPSTPTYLIPSAHESDEVKNFSSIVFDPDRIANAICPSRKSGNKPTQGICAGRDYYEDRWPDPATSGVTIGTPLAPIKNGHLSMLATAGLANGEELVGKDGRRLLIKGHSSKVVKVKKEEDEEFETETRTDRFVTALWGVNLESGALVHIETGGAPPPEEMPGDDERAPRPVVEAEELSFADFISNFGPSLAERVAVSNPPLFKNEEEQLPWVHDRLKQLLRTPLGRQRDFMVFLINALVNGRALTGADIARIASIAEMATGKTYLNCGVIWGAEQVVPCFPALVLCPVILARKWKREAEQTIPGVKAVIVRRLSTEKDAAEFRAFDPSFRGRQLSSVGCLERAIAVIKADLRDYEKELAAWERTKQIKKHHYKHWKATVWWEWKQRYVEGAVINPAEPHPPLDVDFPNWLALRPKPVKPLHMVILTSSVAKLDPGGWEPVYHLRALKSFDERTKQVRRLKDPVGQDILVPHCTSCGEPLLSGKKPKEDQGESEDEGVSVVEYLSQGDMIGSGESRKKRWCMTCGSPAWQMTPSSKLAPGELVRSTANRTVALADYIRKRHPRVFQFLIPDEIHEGGDGTALNYARKSLAYACRRSSGLTGTLCNGFASSLFPTFYDINPDVRRDFGYDEEKRWVKLFGIEKETRRTSKKGGDDDYYGSGANSKRKVGKPIIKEQPGFSPLGLKYILQYAAFLELKDVAPNLPPYKEVVVQVPMDDMLKEEYGRFERQITGELALMLVKGNKSGLSPWYQALMCYPTMPYLEGGWLCQTKYGHFMGEAAQLPENHVYNKERELCALVQEEVSRGRRVLVYAEHTGKFDVPERLKKVLQHNVRTGGMPLRVSCLYQETAKPINREQWLRDEVKRGVDVLICNPRLVKVGLDLIEFPTIVFFEVLSDVRDMRQASRRSYRPGQTLPVKVVYMVYPTMEQRLLTHMARKMQTSLAVEGQIPGDGLISFGADEDDDMTSLQMRMAQEIMAALEEQQGTSEGSMSSADELQALFTNVAELEHDAQGYLGVEMPEHAETVVEPIVTKSLPQASFPGEPAVIVEAKATIAEVPEQVVIIPISRINDPWESFRQQAAELNAGKRQRKKKATPAVGGLWGFPEPDPEASESEVCDKEALETLF